MKTPSKLKLKQGQFKTSNSRTLGRTGAFRGKYLAVFLIVFAIIGGYLLYLSFAASTWSAPVALSPADGSPFFSMATSGNNVYMMRSDSSNNITFRRSTDQGANWGSATTIGSGKVFYDRPLIAEGNNVFAFYFKSTRSVQDWCCSRDLGDIYMRRSLDSGSTWQPEVRLTTAGSGYRVAAEIEGNNVYLSWMDYRSDSTWDMYYRRSTNLGVNWSAETKLVSGKYAFGAERPDIVASGNSVHLFWNDDRDGAPGCYTAPVCPEVYYKRSLDGGATWEPDKRLTNDPQWNGRPMGTLSGNAIVITWEQQVAGEPNNSNETYVMRSTDNGSSWQNPQRLSNAVGDSSHSFLAGDATSAYIAWHDGRYGNNEIIYRQSLDNGASWQPDERITNNSGGSNAPFVAATPGYIHVMWGDDTAGSNQVLYSRKALASQPVYQCSDGVDNDNDSKIDYPADTGCSSSSDNDETNPPSGTAKYYISPSGNDNNTCSQSLPCQSFNRAYQIAAPGDTVQVAAGTYPTQIISWRSNMESLSPSCDPNNPSQLVTFDLPNAIRITGNLEVHGSCVFLHGRVSGTMASWKTRSFTLNVDGYTSTEGDSATQYPEGVRVEGLNTGNLGSYSSDRVIVRDADVGPRLLDLPCNYPENRIAANGASGHAPDGVLWERVAIHDQNRTQAAADADCHYGGLQFWYSKNVTIRDSVFERNVVYHIDLGESGFGPINGALINNSFGCPADNSWVGDRCDGQRAVQFDQPANFGLPFTLTGNVAANGPNGLYGCYSEPCSFTGMSISSNTDLAESLVAPPFGSTPPPPPTKPGDINGDGAVNITDLSQLLFYWGTNNSSADINKDGTVDILDFSLLLSNFGS